VRNISPRKSAREGQIKIFSDTRLQGALGTKSLFMAGVAPKRNALLGKNFADPTIKKTKKIYPTSNMN
jgi:hypothetical protein